MSATLVDELAVEVSRTVGLRAEERWTTAIAEALEACVAGERAEVVRRDPRLRARILTEVARRVTVPESYFFRHRAQLDACCDHAVSVSRAEGRRASVWCAGSAGGEEPYSLALLLHRLHGAHGTDIEGSDLNPDVVAKARDAVYTAWSFRGAPSWCLAYFDEPSPGLRRIVHPDIVGAVRFEEESVQAGASRRHDRSLDVVLFRNVAIYLEAPAIAALHAQFARILRPGGLLALGPSDPPPPVATFELAGYRDHAPVFVRRTAVPGLTTLPVTAALPTAVVGPGSGRPEAPPASVPARSPRVADLEDRRPTLVPGDDGDGPSPPEDPAATRTRGQLHLQRGEPAAAVAALRSAVYLAPHDLVTRHFYALALRESGDLRQAMRQLDHVITALRERAPDERLDDEGTTAVELLRSATFLARQWR